MKKIVLGLMILTGVLFADIHVCTVTAKENIKTGVNTFLSKKNQFHIGIDLKDDSVDIMMNADNGDMVTLPAKKYKEATRKDEKKIVAYLAKNGVMVFIYGDLKDGAYVIGNDVQYTLTGCLDDSK